MPKLFEIFQAYGIYVYRFYKFNQFVYVMIDDKLPVNKQNELIYASSVSDPSSSEFWLSLLEKAYAKVNGCYQALNYGNVDEALVELTGSFFKEINLKNKNFIQDPSEL